LFLLCKTYINLWFRHPRRYFGLRDDIAASGTLSDRVCGSEPLPFLYKTYITLWFRPPKQDLGLRDTVGNHFPPDSTPQHDLTRFREDVLGSAPVTKVVYGCLSAGIPLKRALPSETGPRACFQRGVRDSISVLAGDLGPSSHVGWVGGPRSSAFGLNASDLLLCASLPSHHLTMPAMKRLDKDNFCLLFVVVCLLLCVVVCLLLFACCLLFIVCCLLFIVCLRVRVRFGQSMSDGHLINQYATYHFQVSNYNIQSSSVAIQIPNVNV
jgi:hypothetical protein